MSAFALGRFVEGAHNQAGIAYNGGLVPLLKFVDAKNGSLQHNAAFALYGIAENEDNVSDFIRVGVIQKLQDGDFIVQATRDCVAKTLKRKEEKICGRVLKHLLYVMRVGDMLLRHLLNFALLGFRGPFSLITMGLICSLGFLGLHYISWLTKPHLYLDAFHAMFDGGYRKKDASDIEIPNIRWEVFEMMMRDIYAGLVDVTRYIAQDLLRATDQYLLDGLKHLCEYAIMQDINL